MQKWFKKPANVLQASPEANIPPHHQPKLGFLYGKWRMSCPCGTKIIQNTFSLTHHSCPSSCKFAPTPTWYCSPPFPLPPVNIQAVEADWAERFLARAQLDQIRPPGHIYRTTPAPANKACPVQLSSKC